MAKGNQIVQYSPDACSHPESRPLKSKNDTNSLPHETFQQRQKNWSPVLEFPCASVDTQLFSHVETVFCDPLK